MVKSAPELWNEMNASKYHCEQCDYCTPNRAHWKRHKDSVKHFLMADLAEQCPTDMKVVIASFLPLRQLTNLGRNGVNALTYAQPRLCLNGVISFVDPPVRTVFLGNRRVHTPQTLAFVVPPEQRRWFDLTTVV